MPKSLDEAKIKRMADKYNRFKAKGNQQNIIEGKCFTVLGKILYHCSFFWGKLIPVSVRDFQSQSQLFDYYWIQETGKCCQNELISKLSIEENLKKIESGQKLVIGLTYTSQSFKKIMHFLNSLIIQDLRSQVIICPINLEWRKYQNEIQPKIVLFDESASLFWRGLFNQMIMLSRHRIQQGGIFKLFRQEAQDRSQYERRIKEASQANNKKSDGNSQLSII